MEIELSIDKRPLSKLLDSELLNKIRLSNKDCIHDERLYLEFYFRYGKYLYKKCIILCMNYKYDENRAKDLFQDSMVKAINCIHDFVFSETDSDVTIQKRIKGWLCIIAKNEWFDSLKANMLVCNGDDRDFEIPVEEKIDNFNEEDHIQISYERLQLQEAIATLNDRDRYILMVYADHNCIDTKKHLPDDVIENLCRDLGVTKGNLRIIKLRVLKKLYTYLGKTN